MYKQPHTQDGSFPLISASQKGHDRVVEKLLQAGATVDLQNKVVKLSLFVHLSLHEKVREHIQHIATGGMHGTTNYFVH